MLDVVDDRDPDREYVFANPNDPECGVPMYLAMFPGARVEVKRVGGPRLRGGDGVSEGEAITRMGQILVSYPKSYKVDLDAEVKAKADAFDKRALKDGNINDPLRGKYSWGSNGVNHAETEWPSAATEGA